MENPEPLAGAHVVPADEALLVNLALGHAPRQVRSTDGGRPIAATLEVPQAHVKTRANAAGEFTIHVDGGTYQVIISAPGYLSQTVNNQPNTAELGPGWAWGTLILNQIEQRPLYNAVNFSLQITQPASLTVRTAVLATYLCPSSVPGSGAKYTSDQSAPVVALPRASRVAPCGDGSPKSGSATMTGLVGVACAICIRRRSRPLVR